MEHLHKLREALREKVGDEALKRIDENIANQLDSDPNSKLPPEENEILSGIKLIYGSSKSRIFQVADKISNGGVCNDDDINITEEKKVPIPATIAWNLKLGDNVRIKYPIRDFKSIQKRTLGWNVRLNTVHGHIGIVTGILSEYDNSVSLFFPKVFSECSLFSGVLEKVERSDFPSKWKLDDMVQTSTDNDMIARLQQGLGPIPHEFVGKKGRVIATTQKSVEVTFDEKQSQHVHSAMLTLSDNQNQIKIADVSHPRGFKVGDKVKLISNIRKLIENQKEFGGWTPDMTTLQGSQVTILNIQENRSLNVQFEHNRAWRINHESVLSATEKEKDLADLSLLPNTVVKIKIPRKLNEILAVQNIPAVFIEYLRLTGTIGHVLEDFDYTVQFFNERYIQVCPALLREASETQATKHKNVLKRGATLKTGDTVHLDVGPPNYVRTILSPKNLNQNIMEAMTTSATLLGFIDGSSTAVIQYQSGRKYKINKKYLTVPERFFIEKEKRGIDFQQVMSIQETMGRAVRAIHQDKNNLEWKVDIIGTSIGNPPRVDSNILSSLANHDQVIHWLRDNTDWIIEDTCNGQVFVRGVAGENEKIKLGISFNDEMYSTNESNLNTKTDITSNVEGSSSDDKATPFVDDQPIQRPSSYTPVVQNLQQFRYMRLFDQALGRDVYFPYVTHGPTREPGPAPDPTQVAFHPQVQNHFNIVNSRINNLTNTGNEFHRML